MAQTTPKLRQPAQRKSAGGRKAAGPRRGGRPTRAQAAGLEHKILDAATALFLREGFGATSIEAVAARARISKRTFYARFRDKPDLFRAAVRRLIAGWLPPFDATLFKPGPIEAVLRQTARQILQAALSAEALALYRIMMTESRRFPELGRAMVESGARKGSEHIAELLAREAEAGRLVLADPGFAAEQFMVMVLTIPQRRALGMGPPLSAAELERWTERTVALFLNGCRP